MWHIALAAALADGPTTPQLYDVYTSDLRLDRTGMVTLGAWGAANIVGGVGGFFLAEDPTYKAFHMTNAAWNTVNVGIGAGGLRSVARRGKPSWPGLVVDLEQQRALYLLMIGLDTGYIAGGYALRSRGQQFDDPVRIGMGLSIMFQGAFLLAFDLGMASSKANLARRLHPWVFADEEQVAFGITL